MVRSTATITDAGLTALVEVTEAGRTSVRLATQVDDGWAWQPDELPVSDLDALTLAAAGDWLVLLAPDRGPVTVHVPTGSWWAHDDGPLAGLAAPAAVWTGEQLVVWGGVASATAEQPQPAEGAIWTPPAG
jgi:hypothetical protein